VITKEYPQAREKGKEPFYPVNTIENDRLYQQYKELSLQESNVFLGGRLGEYKYLDMDKTIESAISMFHRITRRSL